MEKAMTIGKRGNLYRLIISSSLLSLFAGELTRESDDSLIRPETLVKMVSRTL